MRKHRLHKVFEPTSVALVGASDKPLSVGGQLLAKLIDCDYQGELFPVNPAHETLHGRRCYRSVTDIGRPVDLVVIAIPAAAIAPVMRECGAQGVGAVMIISAGFAEVGPAGRALQDEVVAIARSHRIALVGPNCLGVIRPSAGLNASFAKSRVAPGQVAMVAQSGAFCTSLLDWADSRGFGFSAVASLGATADVGFGEVLDYLALDLRTRSILLYIEGVSDARAFLSGLRAAARLKPVIVVKSGRSDQGNRAAVSHTGAITGGDQVFDAAIRRAGAVRVETVSQLFSTAQTLAAGIRVENSRLAILTNGGGPGVMATDRAADLQVPLAELSSESLHRLSAALPSHWSHSNPVDILGDASSERYQQATEILLADKNVDGILVLLSPQGMTDPTACARGVIAAVQGSRKPILSCWLGEKLVSEGRQLLTEAGIPSFNSPETGVDAFGHLAAYRRNQNALLQAPPPLSKHRPPDLERARGIVEKALAAGRPSLDGDEATDLLRAFHIPVALPVSDDGQWTRSGEPRQFATGIMRDAAFGPVIFFGPPPRTDGKCTNGQLALPPLNEYLARELVGDVPASIDSSELIEILWRISEIACELPEVRELDIDSLVSATHAIAAHRVHIAVATAGSGADRYQHMAIHPYPPGLETIWQLEGALDIVVRPIRPEDATMEREFVDSLSSDSKYFRFMNHMDKLSPLLLARFTQIDYDREMALVAVLNDGTPDATMLAVARYICDPDIECCEFALTVADDWQRHGLGRRMMQRLIELARARGVAEMEGDVLARNAKMLRLCNSLGFRTVHDRQDPEVVIVRLDLRASAGDLRQH